EDDDDLVHVGGHRLELAASVRAAQLAGARQSGDDHPLALVAGAPDNAVAGDQGGQVGAQMAAADDAVVALDIHLHAEVGNHQAMLLRPQVAPFQLFAHAFLAPRSAGGALFLDLGDAPALPAGELAFGHAGAVLV